MGQGYNYEELSGPALELDIIANLMDKQLNRIDELFRDGLIEEETYKVLTLALINKINIMAVEEVMPTSSSETTTAEDDPLAQL